MRYNRFAAEGSGSDDNSRPLPGTTPKKPQKLLNHFENAAHDDETANRSNSTRKAKRSTKRQNNETQFSPMKLRSTRRKPKEP